MIILTKPNLEHELVSAIEKFTTNYKQKLSDHESSLDENTWKALYDLGATIRHAFDDIQEILVENNKK